MGGLGHLLIRSLAARRMRAVLSVLAVALGVAVMLGVQIGVSGLDAQSHNAAMLRAGESSLDVRATANGGLSTDQLLQVSQIAGVNEVVPLYEKRVVAKPAKLASNGTPVQVSLVGLHEGAIALRPLAVISGRLPVAGSASEIAIDTRLRDPLGSKGRPLSIGDAVVLATVAGDDTFTVVGITDQPTVSETFTKDAVAVADTTLRKAFALGLRTPLAALRLSSGTGSGNIAAEVHRRLGSSVTSFDPTVTAGQPLAQLSPLLVLITALSVLIGAGVSANSVSLSTLERRRDIGLMRAAGASARQVFRLFSAEAAVFAAIGAAVGVGLGIGVGWLLLRIFARPDLPKPPLSIHVVLTLAIAALGVVTALIGAALPALAASRLPILSALRPETGRSEVAPRWLLIASPALLLLALITAFGGGWVIVSAICLLGGVGLALPLVMPWIARAIAFIARPVWGTSGLAAANLSRRRNRTGIAVAGLVVAIAASVASSVLVAGSLSASDSWIRHLFVGDTLVRSPVTQSDEVAVSLATDSGVTVTPLHFFPAIVNGDVIGMSAVDADVYDKNDGLDIISGNERHKAFSDLAGAPSVFVPDAIAAATGWKVGTQLSVITSSGTTTPTATTFKVAAVVSHSFPGGDGRESLIVASTQARHYFGSAATGFDDLEVLTTGRFDSVHTAVARYGLTAVPISEIATASRDAISRAVGLLLGIAVVAIAIGLLAVVNTLAVTIRQSTRELGLLRAVGLSRGQGLRLLLGEAGLMAVSAALIGVLTGAVLALPMLRASAGPGFTPGFVVAPAILFAIAATVVISTVVAALLPARRATGASIVAAVHRQ